MLEKFHGIPVALRRGQHDGRLALAVDGIYVCALADQILDQFLIAHGRLMQHRVPVVVGHIQVGSGFDEQPDDFHVTAVNRQHQGCLALVVLQVQVCHFPNQILDGFLLVLIGRDH